MSVGRPAAVDRQRDAGDRGRRLATQERHGAGVKALAKDPKGRWQTAEELSAALAKVPEMSGEASSPLPAAGGATAAGTSPTVAAKANAPGAASGARPNYVPWAIAGALAFLLDPRRDDGAAPVGDAS